MLISDKKGSQDDLGHSPIIHHTTEDGRHHDHVNVQQLLIRRKAI